MTTHEIKTTVTPAEVVERARRFFTSPATGYGAAAETVSEGCLRVHFDMGDMVIGAIERNGVTMVRGSASRGAHLLTRFLTTLEPSWGAKQTARRYRFQEEHAVLASPDATACAHLVAATAPSARPVRAA